MPGPLSVFCPILLLVASSAGLLRNNRVVEQGLGREFGQNRDAGRSGRLAQHAWSRLCINIAGPVCGQQ